LDLADDVFTAPIVSLGKLWPQGNDYPSEDVITFDLAFVVKVSPKLRLHATPSYAISDTENVTSILLGMSFMGAKKINKRD
jgi:hypothetical protein